jgi:hypothetical protein
MNIATAREAQPPPLDAESFSVVGENSKRGRFC